LDETTHSTERYNYHGVFAGALGSIFMLMEDMSLTTRKKQCINLMRANIIYAITLEKNHKDNKADYEKLVEGKLFSGEGMDNVENLLRVMVEKQKIAKLTPNTDMDFTPYQTLAALRD
jgi:hypothetical protein